MKTKITVFFTCLFLLNLINGSKVKAQQQNNARIVNHNPQKSNYGSKADNYTSNADDYTFKLYTAPNNAVGYDIFKNGKPVFHQFVLTYITSEGKRNFANRPQVEKAAELTIEKIKKKIPPAITEEEIKKIAKSITVTN